MHYLFLGEDSKSKDAQIAALRKKILPSNDAQKFDCDVLYANKLSAEDLKKALVSLPAILPQRLVIIRSAEKFKKQHKDLIQEFFESDQTTTIVVIEAQWSSRARFVKQVERFAAVKEFGVPEGENIFAVTRMMTSRRHTDALKLLHQIMDDGQHPLQILGGLVWFWGNKVRGRVSRDAFEQGLLYLQEADLNMKRSRLVLGYALEVLITKLCVLLN